MNKACATPTIMTYAPSPNIRSFVVTVVQETKLYETTQSDEVISDVAEYLEIQINLLPRILRLGVRLAFSIFNVESIIFHRKTFAKLSHAARTQQMKRWTRSRITAKRDFIRYVRSLVLYNYYDHPSVRSGI